MVFILVIISMRVIFFITFFIAVFIAFFIAVFITFVIAFFPIVSEVCHGRAVLGDWSEGWRVVTAGANAARRVGCRVGREGNDWVVLATY